MSRDDQVTLQILDRADKEIIKLSPPVIGQVYEFMHKFRKNPQSRGLNLEPLHGDDRLYSARVNRTYRAIMIKVEANTYLLVAVGTHAEYENQDRLRYTINRVTGGLEVIADDLLDLTPVGDSLVGRILADPDVPRTGPGTRTPPVPTLPTPTPEPTDDVQGLFTPWTDAELLGVGVSELLIDRLRTIRTEDDLLTLVYSASTPQTTGEVLMALHDNKSLEWIEEYITKPVRATGNVDPQDYLAALTRPTTVVTSDDATLRAVLSDPFARWQAFLHPTQREIVDKTVYTGSARVTGGPGTGKTVVALHRVKTLARQLDPEGTDRAILLTTFTRNLANDLTQRLSLICEPHELRRIDVVSVDRLAYRVLSGSGSNGRPGFLTDELAREMWADLLNENSTRSRWDRDFLMDEWTQVIVGQSLDTRAQYFRARRVGRGRTLTRKDRDEIWNLCEQYSARLAKAGKATTEQIADLAARREQAHATQVAEVDQRDDISIASRPRYRYQHIVVDEAQDLSPAHWRMLRAMTAVGPNDLFICGDTHQRLYSRYITLKSLGIQITGRSKRLTLSYRCTGQILRTAARILDGSAFDDLDDGTDTLDGFRSLLNGAEPTGTCVQTDQDVARATAAQLARWRSDGHQEALAVAVPTKNHANQVQRALEQLGIPVTVIGKDGAGAALPPDTVQVGTFHRFKGLEFRRVVLAYVDEESVPGWHVRRYLDTDIQQYAQEVVRARSLLFVAATRARDELAIIWHGRPSSFLPPEIVEQGTTGR